MSAITSALSKVLARTTPAVASRAALAASAVPAAATQVTRSFASSAPADASAKNRVIWTQHSFLTFDPETQAILTSAFEKKKTGEGLKTVKRQLSHGSKLPSALVNTLFANAAAQNSAASLGAGLRGYSTLHNTNAARNSAQPQPKSSGKNSFVARHAFLAMDDTQQFLREQAELEKVESARRERLSAASAHALSSASRAGKQ